MRIHEITDAQGQLELLRTVIDNTWTAIAQQAEQEKRLQAERKAKTKLKKPNIKASKAPTTPSSIPIKKIKPTTTSQPTPKAKTANPHALAPIKPLPYSHTQPNPKLNPTALTNPNTIQAPATNASTASKDGYFGKNIGATEKHGYGDDRHSKNGIATLKKLPRNFQHPST
jgi:hypothetical protein